MPCATVAAIMMASVLASDRSPARVRPRAAHHAEQQLLIAPKALHAPRTRASAATCASRTSGLPRSA